AARCAAPEVEAPNPRGNGPFHESPVERHVRGDRVMRGERGGPGQLELLSPAEAGPACDWQAVQPRAPEPGIRGKPLGEGTEQDPWQGRSSQIAHVTTEDFEEGI